MSTPGCALWLNPKLLQMRCFLTAVSLGGPDYENETYFGETCINSSFKKGADRDLSE